jgi:DNA-binding NarL/FixJ family response regulator
VLVGDLEPMARLGTTRLLAEGGAEVMEEAQAVSIVDRARNLMPDAVVLRLDDGGAALGARVRAAVPAAKVILLARDETEIRVYDPGRSAPRRIFTAVSDALLSEIAAV